MPIHPSHQDYLGVHYVDPELGVVYFVWVVLCLGLRDAAHIFTRLIAPLMSELRRRGYRGLIYIGGSRQCFHSPQVLTYRVVFLTGAPLSFLGTNPFTISGT